jgi:hypothetical protein
MRLRRDFGFRIAITSCSQQVQTVDARPFRFSLCNAIRLLGQSDCANLAIGHKSRTERPNSLKILIVQSVKGIRINHEKHWLP